jgi:D-alanine transaminase
MKNLGYYNGKVGLIEKMQIPMTDRAFYFGDGVYDAVMCRNNIPYLLLEHIERLYFNCKRLGINPPISKEELEKLICEFVKIVEGNEKFVYFHISRGSGLRNHSAMPESGNICIMITPQEIGNIKLKMRTIVSPDIRYELCDIKTLNLLPSVLASQKASKDGADEAIFHRNGIVTEGTHSNVSIIKNGEIITAPADKYILPGVTRAHLISEAKALGITVREEKYTIDQLCQADEILITSSSKILRGVESIDGVLVGGKNKVMLETLQEALLEKYLQQTS